MVMSRHRPALPAESQNRTMANRRSEDRTIIASSGEADGPTSANHPHLRVIYPRDVHRRWPLEDKPLVIGRGDEADCVLPDAMISREHCRISHTDKGFLVEDLGSTNGTIIDGHPVDRAFLHPHSRLKVGPFVLKLEYIGSVELSQEDRLFAQANTDQLTGVPNRRWLLDQGLNILGSFRSGAAMLSAAMIDVDFFKKVNDTWGHAAGDAVLVETARLLDEGKREIDLLGRYGGEEFLLLLPETTAHAAAQLCERLRASVAGNVLTFDGQEISVTISIGICGRNRDAVTSLDELIQLADKALYRAKRAGRDQVFCDA